MYACISETGSGFFEGVYKRENRQLTFRDPPHSDGQATMLDNTLSDLLSRFAEEIASVRVRDPACRAAFNPA
jgi:hypothetical protein